MGASRHISGFAGTYFYLMCIVMDIEKIIKDIIDCAYVVAGKLAPGYLEVLYRRGLVIELEKRGIDVRQEVPISVVYDDVVIGDYRADLMVANSIIVELKAVSALVLEHEVQLVNYLTATGIDHGLLINFGTPKLQIKRKYRIYKRQ